LEDRLEFFDSTSSAVVSASAAFLRRKPRSSFLIRRRSCLVWFGLARSSSGKASACVAPWRHAFRSFRYTPFAQHQAPLAFSSIAAVVNTASNRAAAVHTFSRAGWASASLRQRSSVSALTPISRPTSSADALSGGSIRATARSLNACPHLATRVLHRHPPPRIVGSIGATTILTRGVDRVAQWIERKAVIVLSSAEKECNVRISINQCAKRIRKWRQIAAWDFLANQSPRQFVELPQQSFPAIKQ